MKKFLTIGLLVVGYALAQDSVADVNNHMADQQVNKSERLVDFLC